MHSCLICATSATAKFGQSPYWMCPNCDCWFQSPAPPKTYLAEFEGDPAVMSDADRAVNVALAESLFKNVMGSRPGPTLDIGAKLPVLGAALRELGCDAFVLEHEPIAHDLTNVVTTLKADFETQTFESGLPFRLVTLIHVFEHLYDPLAALRKLRKIIADDGALFIRMPDHAVRGFERDLTDGHYTIHPFYHTRTSLLQALYETEATFALESWSPMPGYGQADCVLRPIKWKPRIALGAIVKNELRDLPKMLKSVGGAVDLARVIDTGSTDGTLEYLAKPLRANGEDLGFDVKARQFTHASRWVDDDWKLLSFSAARNEYLADIEQTGADWVLSLDADDVLETPDAIRRASYWNQYESYAPWIRDGGSRWLTHRMWRNRRGVRFEGRCHEYPKIDAVKSAELPDALIVHKSDPHASQENSNKRNLRMLTLEWADRESPRTAFYLANTHKDAQRWTEAIEWYQKRIEMGEHYRDEWLFARLFLVRCLRALKEEAKAIAEAKQGIADAPGWAEFRMQLAHIHFEARRYEEAIETAQPCMGMEITPTALWREPHEYRDQPPRLISFAYEQLGDLPRALAWADKAMEMIGEPDQQWYARCRELRDRVIAGAPQAPAVIKRIKPRFGLLRPGAIGDVLMTLNLIPALREANPEHEIVYFCDKSIGAPDALGTIMLQAGVDVIMDTESAEGWRKSCDKFVSLVGYPLHEGYPEKPMRRHLLSYFAEELGLLHRMPLDDHSSIRAHVVPKINLSGERIIPALPALTLPTPEMSKGSLNDAKPYATVQTRAGWSRYKMWDIRRWGGALGKLPFQTIGVDKEDGHSLHDAIALVANARIHLGIDSWANHASNFYWTRNGSGRRTRAVILWGSTQASAAGYPQNVNISKDIRCQPCFREDPKISRMPRGPCISVVDRLAEIPNSGMLDTATSYDDPRPHACMDDITVDEVVSAARKLWEEAT